MGREIDRIELDLSPYEVPLARPLLEQAIEQTKGWLTRGESVVRTVSAPSSAWLITPAGVLAGIALGLLLV